MAAMQSNLQKEMATMQIIYKKKWQNNLRKEMATKRNGNN